MTTEHQEEDRKIDGDEQSTHSCCAVKEKDGTQPEKAKKDTWSINLKIKPVSMLATVLGIVVILNTIVMGWFTLTVNGKLNDAIEQTKPQSGSLTLIIPSDCPGCGELEAQKQYLEGQNITITDERRLDASSDTAKAIIQKEKIAQFPAMIFSSKNPIRAELTRAAEPTGARASGDTALVWEKIQPPYANVQNGNVAGLVSVTYLTDKSCTACYDVVNTQRSILQNFGVAIVAEKIIDISDAAAKPLLKLYNITSVPTIILSQEAGMYSSLMQVWPQVGSTEADGAYVFRTMEAVGGTYRNLTTGKIVEKK